MGNIKKESSLRVGFYLTITVYILGWGSLYFLESIAQNFYDFFAFYTFQFLVFAFLIFQFKDQSALRSIYIIFGIGILLRLLVIPTEPILEDDFYRYFWDARVQEAGINPYLFPPHSPYLNHFESPSRQLVNYPEVRTIYPPLAQKFFQISFKAWGENLVGWKSFLIVFDLLTGWMIFLWMRRLQNPSFWLAGYLWNPLVLKEVANSAHYEPLPVFLTLFAIYHATRLRAIFALSFAFLSKFYGLLLLPLLIKMNRQVFLSFSVFSAMIVLFYLPFLGPATLWSGAEEYSRYWQLNAGLFAVLAQIEIFFGGGDLLLTKGLIGVFIIFIVLRGTQKLQFERDLPQVTLWILGWLIILSPVVDSWYVLWILPFACIQRNVPWLVFSYLVGLSYSWTLNGGGVEIVWITVVEYLLFACVGIWYYKRNRRI